MILLEHARGAAAIIAMHDRLARCRPCMSPKHCPCPALPSAHSGMPASATATACSCTPFPAAASHLPECSGQEGVQVEMQDPRGEPREASSPSPAPACRLLPPSECVDGRQVCAAGSAV